MTQIRQVLTEMVAPVRERGLKLILLYHEIKQLSVAPVRERGLK